MADQQVDKRHMGITTVRREEIIEFFGRLSDGEVPMEKVTNIEIDPTTVTFTYLVPNEDGRAFFDFDRLEPNSHKRKYRYYHATAQDRG